jgi:hypothetical protein
VGLMTIFYCVTTLVVMKILSSYCHFSHNFYFRSGSQNELLFIILVLSVYMHVINSTFHYRINMKYSHSLSKNWIFHVILLKYYNFLG